VKFSQNETPVKVTEEASYPLFAVFYASYHNAGLQAVIRDFESFFGLQIECQTTQQRFFTGEIQTGNPETALMILTGSLQLQYKVIKDNVIHVY